MSKKEVFDFSPELFTPTRWSTCEDKARFAGQLMAFIENGCDEKQFTSSLYSRLSQMFGFIAHTDRGGFIATYFDTPQSKAVFIDHILAHTPVGDPAWTWSDVEHVIQDALEDAEHEGGYGWMDHYTRASDEATEAEERAELARLAAKYPKYVMVIEGGHDA